MTEFIRARVPLWQLTDTMCAWKRCTETCKLDDMPKGWRWLMTYWRKSPAFSFEQVEAGFERDAALCPRHAQELERLLKDIPR